MKLHTGIWEIISNGHRGELKIDPVTGGGEITGTLRFGIRTPNEYEGNIFGFWNDVGCKITFLREHQVTFKDRNHLNANEGHHRDQVYTGYMWEGTTGPPAPPYLACLAGSFVAFGGSSGSGGTKDRSEFGWVATFPSSTSK